MLKSTAPKYKAFDIYVRRPNNICNIKGALGGLMVDISPQNLI